MTHISPAEMYSKAGIKVQSYSSIARHLEPEEEFVKEKQAVKKSHRKMPIMRHLPLALTKGERLSTSSRCDGKFRSTDFVR